MAANTQSNPWGLDEKKYFISVGGLSQFLSLTDTILATQNK